MEQTEPTTQPPVDEAARQRVQNVRNLALLARQAIGRGDTTMQVKPQLVADLAAEYDAIVRVQADADAVALQREVTTLQENLEAAHQRIEELMAAQDRATEAEGHSVPGTPLVPPSGDLRELLSSLEQIMRRLGWPFGEEPVESVPEAVTPPRTPAPSSGLSSLTD